VATRDGVQQAERALARVCSAGLDFAELRPRLLHALRRLLPVDAAFFATADSETLPGRLAGRRDPGGPLGQPPVPGDHAAARAGRRAARRPAGRRGLLGFPVPAPSGRAARFSSSEAALLARLAPHLAHGLRSAVLLAESPRLPVDERPGVVVLTEGLEVIAVTPEAEHLLDQLPGTLHLERPLPAAVPAVAQALLAQERAGLDVKVPSVRVPTPSGHWVSVSAARLHGPPGERRISVVLAPARPADTVPLLLSAHGLTPREADVARLVLQGATTPAMVRTLHISRYTVQDHLKAVFDKVGVRSRGDLAVRLLGQR
jgi:DNA-binding CsgD family transcriptional regulator